MNLFIRTRIAPYRVDFYNALHTRLGMRMCFYHRQGKDQSFDLDDLERRCLFRPVYLKGVSLGGDSRYLCTGLRKMIVREDPELVIVPEFQLPLFQLWMIRLLYGKRYRIVSMCDDSLDMIEQDNDFSFLHRFLRKLAPRMLDGIIVPHPGVRDWYRQRFGIGTWMPIMMDEGKARERYASLLPVSRTYVDRYGLRGRKVILFVGRLVALKRVDLLLDAFSRIRRDAVLFVVGDGPEAERLKKQAEELFLDVVFTGRLEGDSLYAWYNLADVLALLSSREAFGAVVNEALLGGCRVVVSCHAGASCLVDAGNGDIVKSEDPEEVRAALERQMDLSEPFCGSLRPSRMPVLFDDMMDRMVREILA